MAGKGVILTIVMLVVALFVVGAILSSGIGAVSNGTDTLTASGVDASTIALYGLIGLVAVVAVIMLFLKAGTGGR